MKEKIIVVLVALLGLSASIAALVFLKVGLSISTLIGTYLLVACLIKIYKLDN